MRHDKKSLIAGITIGRAMSGWAVAQQPGSTGMTIVVPILAEVQRHITPVVVLIPPPIIPVLVYEEVT